MDEADAASNSQLATCGAVASGGGGGGGGVGGVSTFDFDILRNKIAKSYKQVAVSRRMRKFYKRRYHLFKRFDLGIMLDVESWYSVTPEAIAEHIALKCARLLNAEDGGGGHDTMSDRCILDGFAGSGGNTIQFATERRFGHVIACDNDWIKSQCAQHNALTVYGLQDASAGSIHFLVQDFFQLHRTLDLTRRPIDAVFLSPPWGGVDYVHARESDLATDWPLSAFDIFLYCRRELACSRIVFFLPRNARIEQVLYMAGVGGSLHIEQNYIGEKLVALTAYYGFSSSLSPSSS